jgi:hypothetical protein
MTAIASPPSPQAKSRANSGGNPLMWCVDARIRSGTKKSKYPTALSRIITGSQDAARLVGVWFSFRCFAG